MINFRQWLQRQFGTSLRRRSAPRRRSGRHPLRIENLERRDLLSAVLAIQPLTWNVIGLDSNNVTAGPNEFPVGARITNTSTTDTATNVQATFVFDGAHDLTGL